MAENKTIKKGTNGLKNDKVERQLVSFGSSIISLESGIESIEDTPA